MVIKLYAGHSASREGPGSTMLEALVAAAYLAGVLSGLLLGWFARWACRCRQPRVAHAQGHCRQPRVAHVQGHLQDPLVEVAHVQDYLQEPVVEAQVEQQRQPLQVAQAVPVEVMVQATVKVNGVQDQVFNLEGFEGKTCEQLRQALRSRGLPVTGLKSDLQKRLQIAGPKGSKGC